MAENIPPQMGQRSQVKLSEMTENVPPQMTKRSQEKMPEKTVDNAPEGLQLRELSVRNENIPPQVGHQDKDHAGGFTNSPSDPLTGKPQDKPLQGSNKKNKKKSTLASSLSKSLSFITDASESVQSPTEVGTSESFTARSTNTSFSNQSSRKQSLASGTSDTNLLEAFKSHSTTDGPPAKQRAASGKGRRSNNHPKKENEPGQPSQVKNDSNEQSQSKDTEQQIQPKNDAHENAKKDSHEKNPSKEKGKQKAKEDNHDHGPMRQNEQQKSAKKDTHVETASTGIEHQESKDNKQIHSGGAGKQTEPKKDFQEKLHPTESEQPKTSKDDTTTGSQRKADAKGAKAGKKSGSDAGPASQTKITSQNVPDKVAQSPSMPVLDDPGQWPALGPVSSPRSAIADGKRPPPLPAPVMLFPPLAQRKPVVPAVPIIPKKPRPQP
jgi:hypothetical protein